MKEIIENLNFIKGKINKYIMPFLGVHPKECKSGYNKDSCTSTFIAAFIQP
jgi:hypothetical protein